MAPGMMISIVQISSDHPPARGVLPCPSASPPNLVEFSYHGLASKALCVAIFLRRIYRGVILPLE